MKFNTSVLFCLSFIGVGTVLAKDTDGEVTVIKMCGGNTLEVKCEWEASASSRRLRGYQRLLVIAGKQHRLLDMDLDDVECTATYEDADGDTLAECETELEFPDDFAQVEIREADSIDDFCVFTANNIQFTCLPGISAALEIELKEVDHKAVYDDEKLIVRGECPNTPS